MEIFGPLADPPASLRASARHESRFFVTNAPARDADAGRGMRRTVSRSLGQTATEHRQARNAMRRIFFSRGRRRPRPGRRNGAGPPSPLASRAPDAKAGVTRRRDCRLVVAAMLRAIARTQFARAEARRTRRLGLRALAPSGSLAACVGSGLFTPYWQKRARRLEARRRHRTDSRFVSAALCLFRRNLAGLLSEIASARTLSSAAADCTSGVVASSTVRFPCEHWSPRRTAPGAWFHALLAREARQSWRSERRRSLRAPTSRCRS